MSATLRVMSFNLRNSHADDGLDHWVHRKRIVMDAIRRASPDLLGTQEGYAEQVDFLREQLPDYEVLGVCRDDGRRAGEACVILFRRDRFDLIESGTFWLSETPEAPGSKGWDADLPRICTWSALRDCRGGEVLFLNTHFDHLGVQARVESAHQLRRFITENVRGRATILTGDFNDLPASEPHRILTTDLLDPFAGRDAGTWHGFTGIHKGGRIDWILCSNHFDVTDARVDDFNESGRFPSDHFPIIAMLRATDRRR